jgi:hypothetical protein
MSVRSCECKMSAEMTYGQSGTRGGTLVTLKVEREGDASDHGCDYKRGHGRRTQAVPQLAVPALQN